MKNNFKILKKQIRFYIFLLGILLIIFGCVFKMIYSIEYNKEYQIMCAEQEYIFTDIFGNEQNKTIYPYQVDERLSDNVVMLDGSGLILIIGGFFIILFSGIACVWTLLPNEYKATKDDIDYSKIRSKVECPYCHSTNTTKISAVSKAGSVAMFGIFSQKVKHQWHCNSCKSDF